MAGPGQPPQQGGWSSPPGWQQDPATGQWVQTDPGQTGQWGPQGPPTGQWGPQGPPTAQWGPQNPPTGQWGPQGGTAPAPANKRKLFPVLTAVVLAVALTVGGLYYFGAFSSEVRVEPVAYTDPDQFTASVGDGQTVPAPTTPVVAVGNAPGLYGGTGTNACDVNQLVGFLQATPDKAAAWAGVLGISTSDIPNYVAGLTPVLLRVDTAVTNHGFRNGKATTVNSVLQAGSAVLVDRNGVPRVRCKCGNPLVEGKKFSRSSYTGAQWGGFNPTAVILVQASARPITTFQVVNPTTGTTIQQPSGSTVTGATSSGVTPSATPSGSAVPSPVPPAGASPAPPAGASPAPPAGASPAPPVGVAPPPPAGGGAAAPGTPGLPGWSGHSYSLPKRPDQCDNLPQTSCDNVLVNPFKTTITCSSATVCTSGSGLQYHLDSGLWTSETQLPAADWFTCHGTPVPTTRLVQVGVDPDGTIDVNVTISADPTGCPSPFTASARYSGKPT